MQLAAFLKTVNPDSNVVVYLGLKRKHYRNDKTAIKTILANRLRESDIKDFSIICYLKRRGKNSFSVNPEAVNIFLNGPDFKISQTKN